jgi:hypothetical protein
MIDEFAVKLATEYLDKQFANGDPADLSGCSTTLIISIVS